MDALGRPLRGRQRIGREEAHKAEDGGRTRYGVGLCHRGHGARTQRKTEDRRRTASEKLKAEKLKEESGRTEGWPRKSARGAEVGGVGFCHGGHGGHGARTPRKQETDRFLTADLMPLRFQDEPNGGRSERQRRGPVTAWGNAPGNRRPPGGGRKVRPTSE